MASTTDNSAADMAAAKRRSKLYGIDPAIAEIPHVGDPGPASEAIRRLSMPVLQELQTQLSDSSLGLVLADRRGRITHRHAPARSTLASMDDRCIDRGYSLAEADVGTNGVGTSLETRRPALVTGSQHHLECFHAFTCANAPIVHPITRRVAGTVGLLCPVEDTGPLLLSTAMTLSSQISRRLLEQATDDERFLLEQFLFRRRSTSQAMAALGNQVLIATPVAQRSLAGVDQAELWDRVKSATSSVTTTEISFNTSDGQTLRLRCHPLHRGGQLEGAVVELLPVKQRTSGHTHSSSREMGSSFNGLIGSSPSWRATMADALAAKHHREPVLIVGERGTGRQSVARAIVTDSPGDSISHFDSAEVLLDGPRSWVVNIRRVLADGRTVVLRRSDELPDDVAAALVTLARTNDGRGRLLATCSTASVSNRGGYEGVGQGVAALLTALDVARVEVPPLRERRDDIPAIAQHLATTLGKSQLPPSVISVLRRQSWEGNVTELRQVLRSTFARSRSGAVSLRHLPRHIRLDDRRLPLHGLRQQEAQAIIAAIAATATRTEAAEQLGISRATLYRRIAAYGLDFDL